jgi:hypothetical protein
MCLNRELTLKWCDLINISDLNYQDEIFAGIYIWGFTIDNVFVPYYMGISDNIIYRIHEHINSIIGGRYTILHSNSLAKFREYKDYKDQNIQPEMSKGILYIPDWPYGFKYFLDNRKVLQPHIDFMVDTFTYSFATVDANIVSKQDLKEIEKICFNQIGKETLVNKRSGFSEEFLITHTGSLTMSQKFKTTNY